MKQNFKNEGEGTCQPTTLPQVEGHQNRPEWFKNLAYVNIESLKFFDLNITKGCQIKLHTTDTKFGSDFFLWRYI